MAVGLAAAVAGAGLVLFQAEAEVVEVALEDAVGDEDGALGGRALVVDGEGAASSGDGGVVNDGDEGGGDGLSDEVGVDAEALLGEVGFESVADGLVDHGASGLGGDDHGHGSAGGGSGAEVAHGAAGGEDGGFFRALALEEVEAHDPSQRLVRHLQAGVVAGHHLDVKHDGADRVGGPEPAAVGHGDPAPGVGVDHPDLPHPRVNGAGGAVGAPEQLDLAGDVEPGGRLRDLHRVAQTVAGGDGGRPAGAVLRGGGGDGRAFSQRAVGDEVGVAVGGAEVVQHPQAGAGAAALHQPLHPRGIDLDQGAGLLLGEDVRELAPAGKGAGQRPVGVNAVEQIALRHGRPRWRRRAGRRGCSRPRRAGG